MYYYDFYTINIIYIIYVYNMKQKEINIILKRILTDDKFKYLNIISNVTNTNKMSKKIYEIYNKKYKHLNINFLSDIQLKLLISIIIVDCYLSKIQENNNRYSKNINKIMKNISINKNKNNVKNVPKSVWNVYTQKITDLKYKLFNINQL